jgi:hypothetical protein
LRTLGHAAGSGGADIWSPADEIGGDAARNHFGRNWDPARSPQQRVYLPSKDADYIWGPL